MKPTPYFHRSRAYRKGERTRAMGLPITACEYASPVLKAAFERGWKDQDQKMKGKKA